MAELKTTALTATPVSPDVSQDIQVNVASIAWAFVALMALIFILRPIVSLVANGKIKNWWVKFRGAEMGVGKAERSDASKFPEVERRASHPVDVVAIRLQAVVFELKQNAKNAAWAEQVAHIDDVEEEFFLILRRRGADDWHIDAVWSRLSKILVTAADRNHVLSYVHSGDVDNCYLQEKTDAFERKYEMVTTRNGSTLPPYTDI